MDRGGRRSELVLPPKSETVSDRQTATMVFHTMGATRPPNPLSIKHLMLGPPKLCGDMTRTQVRGVSKAVLGERSMRTAPAISQARLTVIATLVANSYDYALGKNEAA